MKEERRLLDNSEFYVFLGMAAFCVMLCWQISNITVDESKLLPVLILSISVLSSAMQFRDVWRGHAVRDRKEGAIKKTEWAAFLTLVAASGVYNLLGFYTTIGIVLVIISFLVQNQVNHKVIKQVLIYDAVLIVVMYLCFSVLLGMVTPAGLLI